MSEEELSQDQMVEAIYEYAADRMHHGSSPQQVKDALVEQGLDLEAAGIVVSNLQEAQSSAARDAGKKNMIFGALWCVGGIAVTLGTMSAASGGGTYVVTWGAILFGGIQFFRGLMQMAE